MDAKMKADVEKYRAEEKAKYERINLVIAREGIDKMTKEEMRRHLITCDFRGREVKEIILDRLLRMASDDGFEAGIERGER